MKLYRSFALITVFLFLMTSSAAFAVEGRLVARSNAKVVFVWKNKKAHDEALELIMAGVHKSNPILLLPLLSCLVDSGARAVTTDAGFATHDILVVDGKNAGCRGNVAVEDFKMGR